jgi:4-amino-4-deoxy-L-arabinose transferase-like glycosyltransferase
LRSPERSGAVILAALLCGAAILTRPIGVVLPFVLGPALVLWPSASTRRSRLMPALVFTGLALLAPLGWTVRNYQAAGVPQLTSLVAINAYYHRAAQVEAERLGVSVEDVRQQFLEGASDGVASPRETGTALATMERRALDIVLSDPLGYLASHLAGIGQLLGPDKDVWVQLRVGAPPDSGPARSLSEFVNVRFDGHQDTGGAPRILAVGQLVLLYGLAIIGLVTGFREPRSRAPLALALALILYFLVMSGPEAYARFRVPMMPFVALLSALGLTWLRQRLVLTKNAETTSSSLRSEPA